MKKASGILGLRSTTIEVDVEPDKGAQIVGLRQPGCDDVLARYDWETPLPADRGSSYGDPRLDWLSGYRGGWQEMFPNAGEGCLVDGIPLPFHGEVSTARWDVVHHSPHEALLRCPARLPLVLERHMMLDDRLPVLRISETVQNVSDRPVPYLWGHHPAFCPPPGSRIDLSDGVRYRLSGATGAGADGAWPILGGGPHPVDLSTVPSEPTTRVLFLSGAEGWFALRPPSGTGVACAWDVDAFPNLWLWQHLAGPGFPTYGRGWITALEPVNVGYGDGLAAATDRGDAPVLPPRGTTTSWVTVRLLDRNNERVVGVDRIGTVNFA